MMEEREELTTTSFRVVVSEAEAYSFEAFAMQQLQSSVRLTHITFTPPVSEEVDAYVQDRQKEGGGEVCHATIARLRTLCASGKLEAHTIACFPWGKNDYAAPTSAAAHEDDGNTHKKKKKNRGVKEDKCSLQTTAAAAHPPEQVRLGGLFDVTLPRKTDICSNVDLRFDVDGSVSLEVVGPGSVTFFGEQSSALIPEWLNHRFFNVGDDDEEDDGEDDDYDDDYEFDLAAIHRLTR